MKVLDAFLDVPGEAGTNELARRTGINASTVSRLLSTLVAGGYVEHVPESGRYRLGPHLIRLANHMMSSLDLRTLARPHLTALEQATGETATLSIVGEREAVTVDFVASRKAVASIARVGRPSVAHATATGKVMLAFGARATPDGRLERFTDRTLPDAKMLRREIAGVQEQRPCSGPAGAWRRSSVSRGRPSGSAARSARRRCPCCWSGLMRCPRHWATIHGSIREMLLP
jgi:IclR family acetate operon transcriptional repressor